MAKERKKAEPKVIPPPEPRKRERTTPKEVEAPKVRKRGEVKEEPKKPQKTKKVDEQEEDKNVPQIVPNNVKDPIIMVESTPKKKTDDKYLRIADNAPMEERKLMSEKVMKHEVVFSHYAIDNDNGYHYYLVIKK